MFIISPGQILGYIGLIPLEKKRPIEKINSTFLVLSLFELLYPFETVKERQRNENIAHIESHKNAKIEAI